MYGSHAGAKNVLGQTLYGNTLRTLLDDGFDRLKMALHPIVVYHKESSKLAEKLFYCISDDLKHDTEFGFEMQRELVKILKKVPTVTEVEVFFLTDVQNYKNMLNLCRHKNDFGIDATCVLFAKSHDKSPCDGIGRTVKRLTARASLQRPYSD